MEEITFGTDGVRGVANKDLTPEVVFRLGLAAAHAFGGPVPIGRDTRLSGGMFSAALAAGLSSGGADVVDLGVLPTPGVAALAPKLGASAAGVVSASHNPYQDNGVKFFSGAGRKLAPERERDLERLLSEDTPRPTGRDIGMITSVDDAAGRYVNLVLNLINPQGGGAKVLLDCANGAASVTAPLAFEGLDVDLSVTGNSPDGANINEGCGSTHIADLDAGGFDVAFAFDGDADRVLAVDEKGSVVDGDRILAILARDLQARDALAGGAVVTVMSNLGFFKAMDSLAIPYEVTPVGDRHVAEVMMRRGASVGGEQSGHVILPEYVTTGDGLVTALALLDVMARSGKPLSELADVMDVYPQALINVKVSGAGAAKSVAMAGPVEEAVAEAEERLGEEGRILLRPSGTEPIVRVMVEHADERICREVCEGVADVVAGIGAEVEV